MRRKFLKLKEFLLMSDKKFRLLATGFAACVAVRAKNVLAQRLIRRWHLLVAGGVHAEHGRKIEEPVFGGGEAWRCLPLTESCHMQININVWPGALLGSRCLRLQSRVREFDHHLYSRTKNTYSCSDPGSAVTMLTRQRDAGFPACRLVDFDGREIT